MKTDYRTLMDKPYLGAWDMPDDRDLVVTIAKVTREEVVGDGGRTDDCMVIYFSDTEKPMICNATNAATISALANSKYIEDWIGMQVALYRKDKVKFGKELRDGIRVREYLPKLPDKIMCADCGKEIVAHDKYSARAIAESTRGKFGRPLCWECGEKAKNAEAEKKKASDVL